MRLFLIKANVYAFRCTLLINLGIQFYEFPIIWFYIILPILHVQILHNTTSWTTLYEPNDKPMVPILYL